MTGVAQAGSRFPPLGERVITTFGYKHADNRSNLPSVDFDKNVWSVSVNWAL